MEVSTNRASCFLSSLLVLGATLWLALPNISSSASATAARPAKKQSTATLDSQRRAALEKLYAELRAGAPFAEEEKDILRRFGAGELISDLEADVVISRALFDHFVARNQLSKEQQELLERYAQSVARRDHDIADRKLQLLNMREAAAAAALPRTTPLAPPANDTCAGAEVIPAAGPFPYLTAVTADITDATGTGDPPLPSCQTSVSRSIWYSFTPAATATYTISSCADSPTATTVDDTVMAIYTSSGSCAGTFTELPTSGDADGCDDDSCASEAFQAVITTKLNAGTQYFVVVWEFGASAPTAGNTAVQLRVSRILPPANDTCASATSLTLNVPISGTTVSAGNDYQLSGSACFTGIGQIASTATGHDVVYSFTAPAAANYSFRATGYDFNANLVVYVASTCPAGSPPITVTTCLAAANRDVSSTSEEIKCLSLTNGQQVFVFVDEDTQTEGNSFTIEVNRCDQETEPNDTPATANAVNLPVMGMEGSIGTATDVDFYSLGTVAASSRVFAVVDGVAANSTDFDLRVTTSTDTLEYDDFDNDTAFGFNAPNVEGTPTPAAAVPVFLRVNNFSATASEPYRVYAVVQPAGSNTNCNNCSATNETEPNNTTGQANSAANNYFYGALAGPAPSTDVDTYAFTAQAGGLIFLGLDGDPTRNNTPIDGQIELLDSSGATLMLVNDFHSSSSTTPSPGTLTGTTPFSPGEALVYRIRTTGTYFARVSIGTSSSSATGAGDYLLSISTLGSIALPFVDVLPSNVFYSSIAAAYFSGLTFGTSPTTYSPGAPVPREQMAAFITRTMDQALKRGSERAVADQNWTTQGANNIALTTVGTDPVLVKSDGADLWVGNNISGTVSRVRASDGKPLETWTGATSAFGVLCAMGKVFVTGFTSPGSLYQLDPTQPAGAVTTLSSALGNNAVGVAFDGQRIWTANAGVGGSGGSVSIITLNPTSVTNVSTGFTSVIGVIYDGSNIWVTDDTSGTVDRLHKLDSGGAILLSVDVGSVPRFPAFDGTNIWVPSFSSSTVSVVRATGGLAGTVLATFSGNGLSGSEGAAFDGERILVTNSSGGVSLWRASDLTPIGNFSTGTSAFGVCSDGLNFWITLRVMGKLARF